MLGVAMAAAVGRHLSVLPHREAGGRAPARERRLLGAAGAGTPAPQGRSGFTLVEVLIALVVLMLGIYAMLRIFPRGYSALEMTQQRTIASQLAEAELNRWRLQPEAIPDAIIATDYTGKLIPGTLTNNSDDLIPLLVYGEVAAKVPGTSTYDYWQVPLEKLAILDRVGRPLIYNPSDLTPSQFDAVLGFEGGAGRVVTHPNWQPNSLYLPRTVIGEQVDIRSLSSNVMGVPFHLLSHAPLDKLRYEGVDDPMTPGYDERTKVYVDVYDVRPWVYVVLTDPIGLGEREFAYNVTSGQLYFGPTGSLPTDPRAFKVDYTDPVGRQRVYGLRVDVPGSLQSPLTPPLPPGVDPATIQVHELLTPLTADEHQQWLAAALAWPRNRYYVDETVTLTGMIQFSDQLVTNPLPTDITVVKVDYRVLDWQILVFDVEVPANGVVALPIRGIKGPNYTNPPRQDRPEEVAKGVRKFYNLDGSERPAPTPAAADAYVVAVDRQNGEVLTENELTVGWVAAPKERLCRFRVDYRQGLLIFNYGQWEVPATFSIGLEGNAAVGSQHLHSRSGRTYRIFCRGEADWAVQLSLAARMYARSTTGIPGGPALAAAAEDTRVTYGYGPVHDPGEPYNAKQIYFPLSEAGQVVAVDYYRLDTGTYVSGEVHSISGPDIKDLGEWVCRLSDELRYTPNSWGPVMVRGLSLRARTSWVTQGGASTLQDWVLAAKRELPVQRSLPESWHQVTVTTYLTRVAL